MGERGTTDPTTVLERVQQAMNEHDLEALLACFHPDYRSEQPAHPGRGFGAAEQVRENWSAIFGGVPDFRAELLRSASDGDTAWAEWHWHGTRTDGSSLEMRGVTLLGTRDGRVEWGRLYVEFVEAAGAGIHEAVKQMTGEGRSTAGSA